MRDLVIIASSSRGGSSVFTAFLRRSGALCHLQGEINPLFRLAGLDFPNTDTGSDALTADHATLPAAAAMRRALFEEVGSRAPLPIDEETWAGFVDILHRRLCIQWPDVTIPPQLLRTCAQQARAALRSSVEAFHVTLLGKLQQHFPVINPHYYDLNRHMIEQICPTDRPTGPCGDRIIEEPPFVTVHPWRFATAGDQRPLIIKTPSNAYRLPFYKALFSDFRLRILHLTRNAAASINGLHDGWRYPEGFHAHKLTQPLAITGYTERAPWAKWWWQYDLPPNWQQWTAAPLAEVCGFQWRSAHQHILEFLRDNPDVDRLQVRFEDLIGTPSQSRKAVAQVASWLGIPEDTALLEHSLLSMPPVMSTDRPRHRRWFEKAALLEPVLQCPDTKLLMERLGYDPNPNTWL